MIHRVQEHVKCSTRNQGQIRKNNFVILNQHLNLQIRKRVLHSITQTPVLLTALRTESVITFPKILLLQHFLSIDPEYTCT